MDEFYGILGTTGKAWARSHRKRHEKAFGACEELLFECNGALHDKPANQSEKQLLVSLLFARCLDHFQASVLLLEYGMVAAAKAVLRALCEAMFAACAISRNESAARSYVDDDLRQRQKMQNKALNSTGRELAVIRTSATPQMRADLRDQITASGAKELKTEDLARMGGLHDWYLSVYTMLSHAVHSNIRDLGKHFVYGVDGSLKTLTLGPSDRETGRLLAVGALGVLNARGALGEVYGEDTDAFIDKHEPIFRKLVEEWARENPGYDEWGV